MLDQLRQIRNQSQGLNVHAEWDDEDFDDDDDDCALIAEQDKPERDQEVTELKDPPWLTWAEVTNPV